MTDDALKAKLAAEQATEVAVSARNVVTIKEAPVATQTNFKLPDLTPAQITADVLFFVGLAASVGLKVDDQTSTALTAALIAGLAFVNAAHKLADAFIRGKRADNADKLKA